MALVHMETDSSITEGRGFESHLGLRFFLCSLMVDSLHLPLVSFMIPSSF